MHAVIIVHPDGAGDGTKIIGVQAVADALAVEILPKKAKSVLVRNVVAMVELQAVIGLHDSPCILPDADFDGSVINVFQLA